MGRSKSFNPKTWKPTQDEVVILRACAGMTLRSAAEYVASLVAKEHLSKNRGCQVAVAEQLGVHRNTLGRRLKNSGIRIQRAADQVSRSPRTTRKPVRRTEVHDGEILEMRKQGKSMRLIADLNGISVERVGQVLDGYKRLACG